jgi:biotin transporter BioY
MGATLSALNATTPESSSIRDISVFRRLASPPRVGVNGIIVSLWAALGLVIIGWLPFELPAVTSWFAPAEVSAATLPTIQLDAQLPWVLLMAWALGPSLGALIVLVVVVLALCGLPLLANGGGPAYLLQPGMGYWLGLILAAWITGSTYRRASRRHWRLDQAWSKLGRLLMVAATALVCVHAVGLLYLATLGVLTVLPWDAVLHWAQVFSWNPLVYQAAMALVAMALVPALRWALFLPLY